jgi:hypothetical protein
LAAARRVGFEVFRVTAWASSGGARHRGRSR